MSDPTASTSGATEQKKVKLTSADGEDIVVDHEVVSLRRVSIGTALLRACLEGTQ